jgi:type IX secretion system PorP/SprF family membrane protein
LEKRKYILIKNVHWIYLCLFWVPCKIEAQQLPIFSQYTFNTFLLNPAAAGSEGYTSINLTEREQWIGIKGFPKTHAIGIQTRLYKQNYINRNAHVRRKKMARFRGGKVGIGFQLLNDNVGIFSRTSAQITYAYHIKIKRSQLSLGLTFGSYYQQIDKSEIILANAHDQLIEGSKMTLLIPDFNAGIYFNSSKVYAGFSVESIMNSLVNFGDYNGKYILHRQYNIIGGYRINTIYHYTLEPSFYFKTMSISGPQVDLSLKVLYKKDYWVGLTYRTGMAASIFAGLSLNRLFIGYAYDDDFIRIQKYTWGTHELMIGFKFGDNARRYRWLERY